jgi:acyl-CoA thioester hydrolase
MNNAASYLLFDSVINAYLIKHCGVTPPNSPLIGLVVSSYATYFAPTSFPAILELGLCVTKLGSSSVTYEVGIFEEESQTPAVVGGYTHVFVDSKTRKSKTMTGDIRAGLERLMVKETMTSKAKLYVMLLISLMFSLTRC